MVSETESHKITRKLERAQKALADAMWRKKKQAHLYKYIIPLVVNAICVH
jgi:hypothetical protein